MAREFASRNVQFFYVYKSLAHPGWNNYLRPITMEERLLHIREARRTLGTTIPWLCDGLDDGFSAAMGGSPNSEFILGPDGRIVHRRGWNEPEMLRARLEELVGPVTHRIDPATLGLPQPVPATSAATGVVARLMRPPDLISLQAVPVRQDADPPAYVKLRAEADLDFLLGGEGQLYLSFLLDPVYHVHWNNLSGPVQLDVSVPPGVTVDPPQQTGPQVAVEGDADPRDFMVAVSGWQSGVVRVRLAYVACDEASTWCKNLVQEFELRCQTDDRPGIRVRPEHAYRMQRSLSYRDDPLPPQTVTTDSAQLAALAGDWKMHTSELMRNTDWRLHLEIDNGRIAGWSTFDVSDPEVHVLSFDGRELHMLQRSGPFPELLILQLTDDELRGTHESVFGDFEVRGTRQREAEGDDR